MKTLQQIKEEVYNEIGHKHEEITGEEVDEIAQRYADECAKEALRLASENVTYEKYSDGSLSTTIDVESILSENNLPKHKTYER